MGFGGKKLHLPAPIKFLTWRKTMKHISLKMKYTLVFVITGILVSGSAMADKPSWAGGDKGEHGEKHEGKKGKHRQDDEERSSRGGDESAARMGGHFDDRRREIAHEYYREQYRSGHCPPGLAKKHNGCMPPGQARKWAVGRPLPRDVVYHDVPPALVMQMGQPPAGHRYVQVAGDILMMAIGTGMIVDAIEDIGRK